MEEKNRNIIPNILCWCVIAFFVSLTFVQNFVDSSNYSLLSLRTIDDVAFQSTLLAYRNRDLIELLSMNDYGYGWIYWFPIYILTYPLHFLASSTQVTWPLIVFPRMSSLFWAVLYVLVFYKIVSKYTNNGWIRMACVLLVPLFPAGSYLAGRFGTVCQTAFFAELSVYLIVKYEKLDRTKLMIALSAFAVSMGTKVSAVCIVPLLVILIFNRYSWSFTKKNWFEWISACVVALIVMLGCMSPSFLLFFIFPTQAQNSFRALSAYWITNSTTEGGILSNYIQASRIGNSLSVTILLFVLLVFLAIIGIKNVKISVKYKDYIAFALGYFLGMIYLCKTISTGGTYVFNYSTALSFASTLGLLAIDEISRFVRERKTVKKIYGCSVVVVCITLSIAQLTYISRRAIGHEIFNVVEYFQNAERDYEKRITITQAQERLKECGIEQVYIAVDYQGPLTFYNQYDNVDFVNMLTIWNNLGMNYDANTNVIVLAKDAPGFFEDDKYEEICSQLTAEEKEIRQNDRDNRRLLVEQGLYFGDFFSLIFEDDNIYMFVKESGKN